jgi:hypothetical protein
MSGRPRRDCSLTPFMDGFRRQLELLGYTPGTVCNQLAWPGESAVGRRLAAWPSASWAARTSRRSSLTVAARVPGRSFFDVACCCCVNT